MLTSIGIITNPKSGLEKVAWLLSFYKDEIQ